MTINRMVPYPPSINTYWRHVGPKVLISAKGREYRKAIFDLFVGHKQMQGRIAANVLLHPPDKRRRDIDNPVKALLDALQHAGVYRDDSQIDELHVVRGQVSLNPCAVVELTETGGRP